MHFGQRACLILPALPFRAHRWPILVLLTSSAERAHWWRHSITIVTHTIGREPLHQPQSQYEHQQAPIPPRSMLTLSPNSRTKLDPQRTNGASNGAPLNDVIPEATSTPMWTNLKMHLSPLTLYLYKEGISTPKAWAFHKYRLIVDTFKNWVWCWSVDAHLYVSLHRCDWVLPRSSNIKEPTFCLLQFSDRSFYISV